MQQPQHRIKINGVRKIWHHFFVKRGKNMRFIRYSEVKHLLPQDYLIYHKNECLGTYKDLKDVVWLDERIIEYISVIGTVLVIYLI